MKILERKYSQCTKFLRRILSVVVFILPAGSLFAQTAPVNANAPSVLTNNVFLALITIIFLLLLVIYSLSEVLKAAARNKSKPIKQHHHGSDAIKILILTILFSASANVTYAQDVTTGSVNSLYGGLDVFTFWFLIGIILFELLIIWLLYRMTIYLLIPARERVINEVTETVHIKKPSILEKLNQSVAIEQEADIMLDHNYDGIHELDNNLPPWWKYGFYLTIIFSVIYMIHYHVANTGKSQLEEYDDQIAMGKIQVEEFRRKAINMVDEFNATMLTDESSMISGKGIFMENCTACHGRAGEGGVGPNLTDDYWIHEGGIKGIFKTIKYGYPEKGMKSWQQDLTPKKIQEVASYTLSLRGTNPPNQKEKQGELYVEPSDTTLISNDTAKIALKIH